MSASDAKTVGAPHPWLFFVLLAPFGLSGGYVGVTLAYLLAANGVSVAAIAAVVAMGVWPQTWKVFWAPAVDTTLNSKLWYGLGAVGVGAATIAMSVLPARPSALPLLSLLVVVSSIASSLTSMASETFLANLDDHLKGRASGWSQAGNFAGGGVGGGIGLYLAQHVGAHWVSGAALGALCVACCAALPWVAEPPRAHARPRLFETLAEVARDVWSVARSRAGLLVMILMLLPMGTGAAGGLWAAVAGEWRANADTVALINGVVGGVVSAAGCLIGGYVCDRLDRRTAYCLFGLLVAAATVVMALAPRTPVMFVVFTLLYSALVGACYCAYSAVVLEAIGRGAAATKFNLMASISNIPIAVMTTTDGWLHDRGGSNLMLYGEAAAGVAAVAVFVVLAAFTRRIWPIVPNAAAGVRR
jgi:MFS family permease